MKYLAKVQHSKHNNISSVENVGSEQPLVDATMRGISKCCDAPIIYTDICGECLEHCDEK